MKVKKGKNNILESMNLIERTRNVEGVSLVWLASIAGVPGVQVALKEPQPIPPTVKPDEGLRENQETIRLLRGELSHDWTCFA